MLKRTVILLGAATTVLAATAIVSVLPRNTPDFNASVSFLCYTSVVGGSFAAVSITNTGGVTLNITGYWTEELGHPSFRPGPLPSQKSLSLAPRTSDTLCIPIPTSNTGNAPWRGTFWFSADSSRLSDRFSGRGRRFVPEWLCRPPPAKWTQTGWIDR